MVIGRYTRPGIREEKRTYFIPVRMTRVKGNGPFSLPNLFIEVILVSPRSDPYSQTPPLLNYQFSF